MNLLIEEFGREYTTCFSILSLISSSKTSRSEIESILGKNTGGYLDKLEHDYHVIQKVKPVLSGPGGKVQKYFIDDNFSGFRFRFIYKNKAALEIGNYSYARSIAGRDFESFSGPYLGKYFREKLAITESQIWCSFAKFPRLYSNLCPPFDGRHVENMLGVNISPIPLRILSLV